MLPLINVLLAVLKKNTSEHTLKKIIIANIWPLFCICMDPALKRIHIFLVDLRSGLWEAHSRSFMDYFSTTADSKIKQFYGSTSYCAVSLLCQVLKEDTLWTQDEGTLIRMCRNKWRTTMYSCVCMLYIKQ